MTDRLVDVPGGRIWSETLGRGAGTPLVALHGGPGWPSPSLEPLAALADVRPVVFYDQLGCGRSDRPDDTSLWVVDRFVEELVALLDAWELDRVCLLGHSWGTILAVEATLAHPDRVAALVLTGPALSIPRYAADTAALLAELPEGADIDTEWSRRHFCRLDPTPEPMRRASAAFGEQVYLTMNGTSEYQPDGNLAACDLTPRLGEIRVPTLLTCGRHDACTPSTTAWYASLIPGAEVVVFEDSSHVAFHEEREHYLEVVEAFLGQVDGSP